MQHINRIYQVVFQFIKMTIPALVYVVGNIKNVVFTKAALELNERFGEMNFKSFNNVYFYNQTKTVQILNYCGYF